MLTLFDIYMADPLEFSHSMTMVAEKFELWSGKNSGGTEHLRRLQSSQLSARSVEKTMVCDARPL